MIKNLALMMMVLAWASVAVAGVVTDNLVFELNAAAPGASSDTHWRPVVGPPLATGRLEVTGPSELLPLYATDTDGVFPIKYFDFQVAEGSRTDGGRVADLGVEVDSTDPDDFIFLPMNDFTVELWFYSRHVWEADVEFETLFSTMNSSSSFNRSFTLQRRMQSNYQLGAYQAYLMTDGGDGGRNYFLGSTNINKIPNNEWTQIVLVFNKDTGTGDSVHTWYINGEVDRSHGTARNTDQPLVAEEFMAPPNQLSLGARFDGAVNGVFNGGVSVARVYSAALTPQQIAANYEAGIAIVADVIETDGFTEVEEEGETSDTFDVFLTAESFADVEIQLVYDANQITVSPEILLFEPHDLDPQTVTVTAIDDDIVQTPTYYTTIALMPISADPAFDGKPAQSVTVRIIDNDSGVVTVEPTLLYVMEEGETSDVFTVGLSTSPFSDDVVIEFDYDAEQITMNPETLTFTTVNWNIPQTVTVTAVDDDIYEPLIHTTTITSSVTAGSDSIFAGQLLDNVVVEIADNDCGPGRYLEADLTQDCTVGLADFAIMASQWLACSFPTVPGCLEPWLDE